MTSIPDYGNITMEDARRIYEETMKQQVLSKYSFPTKPSGDGFYHIYVRDGTKKTGRRAIKAKTLENLRDKVFKAEKGITGSLRKTFKDGFEIVQEEKSKYIKDPEKLLSVQNTVVINRSLYKRFFQGTAFESKYIDDISKKDIEDLCYLVLSENDISSKAFLNMRSILKAVFSLAFEQYWILDNPYGRVNFKKFESMLIKCTPTSKRFHPDDEIDKMIAYIHEYQHKHPGYIPAYSLELQIIMGLRRGEVAPLLWADVEEFHISINKEQLSVKKSSSNPKEYCKIVGHTKTYVDRCFPITAEIRSFLNRLKEVHEKHYPDSIYLFPDRNDPKKPINNSVTYKFYARMCRKLGIEISHKAFKGPHSFRRNGITKVANSPGGNIMIASTLYGNSVQAAARNYYTGVDMTLAKKILEVGYQGNQKWHILCL